MTATSRRLALLVVICITALFDQAASGQPGVPLWTNRLVGAGGYNDVARCMAVDAQGNVFVGGHSLLGDFSTSDYLTVGYSSIGLPLWTNRFDAGGEDVAAAVAVDNAGNVFVTGHSFRGGSGLDYLTVKYSKTGLPLWTNRYDGPLGNQDQATSVATGANGDVFVTGNSYSNSIATVAYSNNGVPLWTNRYNGPGNAGDYGVSIAVDPTGGVIVTGFSAVTGSGTDFVTIKYSSAGVELWVRRYNGPGNSSDEAHAVATDQNGNVYVTGSSFGVGSSFDYATIKYSSTGVPLWTNRYDGPGSGADDALALALDTNATVYVTGYSVGSGGSYDYATVAYSTGGLPLWTNRYSGPGNAADSGQSVAVDKNGNVFVSGYSTGAGGNRDYATVAYSSVGAGLWTNRYDGPGAGTDEAVAVKVDSYGAVYVAGASPGSDGSFDYATIRYASMVASPIPLQIQRMSGATTLSWGDARFILQSAPTVIGNFTNVPAAGSPYTNAVPASQQFFRLKAN